MSWIKCDSKVKAKCAFKIKCCGDYEGVYLAGSDCDEFAQKVLSEPTTNADRIRAMSDEELAWELMTWRMEAEAKHHGVESNYPNTQAKILEWLEQPVWEGADHGDQGDMG